MPTMERTRKARHYTTELARENAALEVKIFEAIDRHCITTTEQLANILGLRVCEIHGRVTWLKRNCWIINIHSPEGWKIGMGGEE